MLLLVLSGYLSGTSFVKAQSLTLDKQVYAPGNTITAIFSNTPGNDTDWIGIYPDGVIPSGNPPSTLWFYTNNTQQPGGGTTSGTVKFENINLAPGYWTAFFLLNDGYEWLTDGVPFIVAGPPALIVANPELRPDEMLHVTVQGRPEAPADRLAFFRAGEDPLTAEPALWVYLNGSQTLPDTGFPSIDLSFDLFDLEEGEWRLHFQAQDNSDIVPPVTITIKRVVVINSFTVDPPYLEEPGTIWLSWDINDDGLPLEKVGNLL